MPSNFEIIEKDGAGRIGRLRTPHGIVETPTVMPVINPNLRIIEPAEMKDFGAEILITNSYIIYNKKELREKALKDGLHELLGFDGPIMTDSGSFQLSVYGEINVENHEIISFEQQIGTDIGVPLDIPTGPDVSFEKASGELEITHARLKEAREIVEKTREAAKSHRESEGKSDGMSDGKAAGMSDGKAAGMSDGKAAGMSDGKAAGMSDGKTDVKRRGDDMMLAGPIQGSTHKSLREKSAAYLSELDFDVYPIGAVVPLMEAYRYSELVDIIVAAKKNLTPTAPVHLFGAGHPMMFALAVALGCDLFDSAAYALYAKGGRYITVNGTYMVDRLKYLPCSCPVCMKNTAESLKKAANKEELLARHNLYVTFEEIRQIKQAISDGKLMELVELRCHSHPKILGALDALFSHSDWLEQHDPAAKSTFFECSAASANRPEVLRYGMRLSRLSVHGNVLIRPHSSPKDKEYDFIFSFKPPFGAYPVELDENYPFNAEVLDIPSLPSLQKALDHTLRLVQQNPDAKFVFVKGKRLSRFDESCFEELKKVCTVVDRLDDLEK
ncbi:tRNA guanosine(15) transglycosylase TgtA [Methanolapillus ohkumae]|uniref:tRNA-guanine(15) transglycosylase n=1 Tax=Methanolapillus ohkumae TaxID=3028298 RepID=A0AA96VDX6_9EURY|nr:Queuine tRNA-ribosyltransferase catalytic subunit 1 [Methanosarcinaceae archaeon Am2]